MSIKFFSRSFFALAKPIARSTLKALVPIGVLAALFVVAGVSTGSISTSRLLGADVASAPNATVTALTAVVISTSQSNQVACDNNIAYRYVTVNASPIAGAATLSVSRDGHAMAVTPGVAFRVPSGAYAISVTYASQYIVDPNSPTSFTVSGTCPMPPVSTTTSTSTYSSTATSTTTSTSTYSGGANLLGTVKFSENMSDVTCPSGTASRNVTINADPHAGVGSASLYSAATGKQMSIVLSTPILLSVGSYYISPQILADYSVDSTTMKFTVSGTCPSTTATSTSTDTHSQTTYYTQGFYEDTDQASTSVMSTATPTNITTAIAPNFTLPSDGAEPGHVRYDVTPRMAKDESVAYTATGGVNFGVELPVNPMNGEVRIFLGDANHWRSDFVFGAEQGLERVTGTNRWKMSFDSPRISNGPWRLRAAYLTADNYWMYTDTFNFAVKNSLTSQVRAGELTLSTSIATSETSAKNNIIERSQHDKPRIRLVVNDRAMMITKPVFDREEVEVRVSSDPIQRIQFLVYSTDGALTPAIKELGGGLRDEVLSREGVEVWTRLVDMGDLPTGSYRIFARVHYTDGKQAESESRIITVQHLSHAEIPAFGDGKSDADIAASLTEETKKEIRKRVTDPSACTTQEECAVFCSSTSGAKDKCTVFARVSASATTTDVAKEVRAAQKLAQLQLGGQIELNIPDATIPSVIGTTSASTSPMATTTVPQHAVRVISKDWKAPDPVVRPSLVDVFPEDALKLIIDRASALSVELPPEVDSVPALQSYCGVTEHIEKCSRIVERLIPSATTTLAERAEVVRSYEEKTLQVFEQRTGARAFIDSNGNGIPDYDKINIYHTDLTKRDTLGSGMSDGALLLGNGNPSKAMQSATNSAMLVIGQNMVIENPKITGSTQPKLLAVASAAVIETEKDEAGKSSVKKILFKGRAPANSFVRIFMFSEPIVVTVKADESGNWSYILDKKLPDGTHTAYAAVADASGRILAKSEPLPFVKTASAISVGATSLPAAPVETGILPGFSPLAIAALIIAMLGIALSVIGVVIGLKKTM